MIANTSSSLSEHECMLKFQSHFKVKIMTRYGLRRGHQKIKQGPTEIENVCIKHSLFPKHKQNKAHLPSA